MSPSTYRELWCAAAAGLLLLAILAAFAAAGWPGEPGSCIAAGTCFCEAFRDGWVRQPANTLSNLGFVAVGLGIAGVAGHRRARRERPAAVNPMTTRALYPGLYATLVVLLGPGSMALHASMTNWGGQVDVISMYLWATFLIAYSLLRVARLSDAGFLAIFTVLGALGIWSKLFVAFSSDVIFGVLLASFAALEIVRERVRSDLRIEKRWVAWALGAFALAFAIWLPSRRIDGPLCVPDSLLQGHAAWHLLCAGSTAALYLYFASERPRVDSGATRSPVV